jgi:hypothetical protein
MCADDKLRRKWSVYKRVTVKNNAILKLDFEVKNANISVRRMHLTSQKGEKRPGKIFVDLVVSDRLSALLSRKKNLSRKKEDLFFKVLQSVSNACSGATGIAQ